MDTKLAQELVAKHGTLEKAAQAAGVGKTSVWRALNRKGAIPQSAPKAGRSLAEFKQTYDKDTIVPKKIQGALKALGARCWDYETDFAKLAGVSMADMGTYRQQFMDFVVTLKEGRKVWAGSVALADELRSML